LNFQSIKKIGKKRSILTLTLRLNMRNGNQTRKKKRWKV